MAIIDYYVTCHGVVERGLFYNYMINKGYKAKGFTRYYMINSNYPFGICISRREITVIESATLCYYASKNNKIKTIEKIKELL